MRMINPTILTKGAHGYSECCLSSLELQKHNIWLTGEVTSDLAISIIRQLVAVSSDGNPTPISIFISTNGGSAEAGFAIYDAIKLSSKPVYTYVVDKAYSVGAAILLAGSKRFIFPHGKVMIHRACQCNSQFSNADSIEKASKELRECESQYIDIISENTSQKASKVKKDIAYDHFFNATEALNYGFVHAIVDVDTLTPKKEV